VRHLHHDLGRRDVARRIQDSYAPGRALTGKYTFLAEGARGSLTQQLIKKFGLDKDSGTQKFGIGLKELWEIPAE
jgi:electron-transferring-flavoprotein dehydrogenase